MATARTDYSKIADTLKAPHQDQDVHEVAEMIRAMEAATKGSPKNKSKVHVKKTAFDVKNSTDGAVVYSWRMNDWDYKKRDLPTYARGLFTTRNRRNEPEIVVRGYDKFFNIGEVHQTQWENILTRTCGPYEISTKENGCIIFISGLEDETLLVCSKHSTGDRSDIEVSHSTAGERWVEKQLAAIGKTKADLARELRSRNVTAVAELCDDTFEEHILDYPPEMAGLYLHGINLNLPQFTTYPSPLVQKFAEDWGFRKTGLIIMDDIHEVRKFLEEVAETGAHGGRDVEGFVIRCRESYDPAKQPYRDWFFKYKFEEPYLMYRQWRECTKAMISGKTKPIRKHKNITEEYLMFARKRLHANPKLNKEYLNNHGIIALRNDFLAFKNMDGSDAAKLEEMFGEGNPEADAKVSKDVILAPIATIGCGKTTIGLALCKLFGWGHIQNDNITGKGRPPRFVRALLQELQNQPAVFADRNNAQKHERRQLLADVKAQHVGAVVVALNFVHDEDTLDEIRRITQERIIARGDNHQTIHAATDQEKFIGVMEGFINRFEECTPLTSPDSEFDAVINLDPLAGSRKNLEIVINELHKRYPLFLPKVPSVEQMDAAFQYALDYKPNLRHDIPDRSANMNQNNGKGKGKQCQLPAQPKKPKSIEYMSVDVPTNDINTVLKKAFQGLDPEDSRFFTQLEKTRRVQLKFHVTLMHRATARDHPELWEKYTNLQRAAVEETGVPDGPLGECGVLLERVVYDDRIMAIVVRLVDPTGTWETVNKVAHITVGTRDDSVKPKESNDLLAKWLEEGVGGKIKEVVFANKVDIKGIVRAVMSR